MERPKRLSARVDYRKYHLSGDLEQVIEGIVSIAVNHIETGSTRHPTTSTTRVTTGAMSSNPEEEDASPSEVAALLQTQREKNSKLQQQVKAMQLRHELETEKMQEEQWEAATQRIKAARESASLQHHKHMERIKEAQQEQDDKSPAME